MVFTLCFFLCHVFDKMRQRLLDFIFFFLFAFMVLQHIRNKLSLMTAILLIIIFLASFSDSLDWNNGLLFLIAIV